MDNDSLQVDLADRDDVRAQLPKAEAILRREEDALAEIVAPYQAAVELWRRNVAHMRAIAGDSAAESSKSDAETAPRTSDSGSRNLDLVVEVVDREMRPIRGRDVRLILEGEGHNLPAAKIHNALYYAAERAGKIKKLTSGRGLYAPLGFRDPEIFDASGNGAPNSTSRSEVAK